MNQTAARGATPKKIRGGNSVVIHVLVIFWNIIYITIIRNRNFIYTQYIHQLN